MSAKMTDTKKVRSGLLDDQSANATVDNESSVA